MAAEWLRGSWEPDRLTIAGRPYLAYQTGPQRWKITARIDENQALLDQLRSEGYWIDAWTEDRHGSCKMITVEFSRHELTGVKVNPLIPVPKTEADIARANRAANDELARAQQRKIDEHQRKVNEYARRMQDMKMWQLTSQGTVQVSTMPVPGTARAMDAPRELAQVVPEPDYAALRKRFILYGGENGESLLVAKERLLEKVTGKQDEYGEWHWDPDPATPLWDPPMRKTEALKLTKEEYLIGRRRNPALVLPEAAAAVLCLVGIIVFLLTPVPIASLPWLGGLLFLGRLAVRSAGRLPPAQ